MQIWASAVIAVVIAVLGIGLPQVAEAIPSGAPLRAGTVLSVGPLESGGRPVRFTVPDGWVLLEANSSLDQSLLIASGSTTFQVRAVTSMGAGTRELYQGLARITPLIWNATLAADAVAVRTEQGVDALSGTLIGVHGLGSGTVLVHRGQGVDAVAYGPVSEAPGAFADVSAMVRSIQIA